jgi:hypothetical protein
LELIAVQHASQPLALTDDQLSAVMRAAESLHPSDRQQFLEAVARALQGKMLGDGVVHRTCAEMQRRFLTAPPEPPRNPSRWSSKRSNGIRRTPQSSAVVKSSATIVRAATTKAATKGHVC